MFLNPKKSGIISFFENPLFFKDYFVMKKMLMKNVIKNIVAKNVVMGNDFIFSMLSQTFILCANKYYIGKCLYSCKTFCFASFPSFLSDRTWADCQTVNLNRGCVNSRLVIYYLLIIFIFVIDEIISFIYMTNL
jgi:hypothetical protein